MTTTLEPTAPAAGQQQAFTRTEFCSRNRIGLSLYHKLKNTGRGPREMALGNAIRISVEAERDWRAARERPDAIADAAQKARVAKGRRAARLAVESPRHVSKRPRRAAR